MNWDAIKPIMVLIFTSALKIFGGVLMAHGWISGGAGMEAFMGAGMTAGGAFWSWWVQSGHLQAAAYLKKLTSTATQAAAIEVAKRLPISSTPSAAVQTAKAAANVTEPAVMAKDAAAKDAAAKAIPIILLALLLGSLAPGDARAQTKPRLTGNIVNDIAAANAPTSAVGASPSISPQALMQKIMTLAGPDLTYTAALAAKANTNASGVRLKCVQAIQALNSQVTGVGLTDADGKPLTMPDSPHIFTDLEIAAEGIDSLSPTGPLFTSCAGAAALAGMNVLAFINALVTGTTAAAIVVPK